MKKTFKRTLALLLTVVMISSVAAVMPVVAETQGATAVTQSYTYKDDNKNVVLYGSEAHKVTDDTITVDNTTYKLVDDEAEFKAITASGNYILMDDITFETTFSQYVINAKFTGILEGNGKLLKSLSINIPRSGSSAIFSQFDGTATVKNMSIYITFNSNGTLSGDSNCATVVGGVLSTATDTRIENIKVNVTANIEDTTITTDRIRTVSGIAGNVTGKLTIKNCTVNGSITIESKGPVYGSGFMYQTNVSTANVTIENCINNADIKTASEQGNSAGFLGRMLNNGAVHLSNCSNNGNITSNYRASAIAGYVKNTEVKNKVNGSVSIHECFSMKGCENEGTITQKGETINNQFVDYLLTDSNTGVVKIDSFETFKSIMQDTEKDADYYVLTDNIDLGGNYDVSRFKGTIDFCGYSITGNNGLYTGFDEETTNLVQPIVSMVPTYVGYQTTEPDTNGEYAVRFLAVVDDYTLYDEIGFDVTINGIPQSFNCWSVYSSVIGDYGNDNYSAAELGGKYIVAIRLMGIEETISDAKITPWVKYKNSTERSYGKEHTVSVVADEDVQGSASGGNN